MQSSRLLATAAAAALVAPLGALAQERSILPIPRAPFDGEIAENVLDAKPGSDSTVRAPEGAPNVVMFMSDDVGFAMTSAFGGPVPTPNFERLAQSGQRYNRFHTTAICSPSRAALLTGRNPHNAGVGWLSDINSPYPGYDGRIQADTATIAQVLRLNGWNTAMFGKHHNIPSNERSAAGPFDAWPTGIGFEYYFGFPYGDIDQYQPSLYRGIQPAPQDEAPGKMLDVRFADDIIRYVHNQKAGNPDKPFLIYWAPGSTHAPHQAPADYIERFKGKFDQGWDKMRLETWKRQLAMGIIPKGARLTPRPAELPAWDSLSQVEKEFHARSMETAAAQMVLQDEQIGRVIDELKRMGQYDNTLFAMVLGDNGASGEAGPPGTINELRGMRQPQERAAWMHANTEKLGSPMSYGNYSVGWAWAMNTPLPWVKQYASMLGGIRNGAILSWSGHVKNPGGICAQFGHLNDIVPTVLEAAKIPAPDMVLGTRQKPMDGQSLLTSLDTCEPNKPRTQYFEITGKVGLYHNGLFLSGDDGRDSWKDIGPGGARPEIKWALYDLDKDFSQSTDLAARMPEELQLMITLFKKEAFANNVFPLDHRFGAARREVTGFGPSRKHYDFWGKDISIPGISGPILMAQPFSVEADVALESASASGAILALGSRFGGWSLYLDEGRPAFVWAMSTDPREVTAIRSDRALPAGKSTLRLDFATGRPGSPAKVTLTSGGAEYAKVTVPMNFLMPAGNGEMLDIGRDLGVPVTEYKTPQGAIQGDISHVRIDFR